MLWDTSERINIVNTGLILHFLLIYLLYKKGGNPLPNIHTKSHNHRFSFVTPDFSPPAEPPRGFFDAASSAVLCAGFLLRTRPDRSLAFLVTCSRIGFCCAGVLPSIWLRMFVTLDGSSARSVTGGFRSSCNCEVRRLAEWFA